MGRGSYPVVEVFGPTIQGEGALAGAVSHFVRFGGCDFSCDWCDSAHAVLVENVRKVPKLTDSEIVAKVLALGKTARWVTLSGGNPALFSLDNVVDDLQGLGFKVAIETQGSRWKDWLTMLDHLTVSPKPPSSGMVNKFFPTFMQYVEDDFGPQHTCIKVPVYDEPDLDFALDIHHKYYNYPFYISVVTEMGGLYGDFADGRVDTAGSLLARYQRVAQDILKRGAADVRVLPQLHYLLWGNKTGV